MVNIALRKSANIILTKVEKIYRAFEIDYLSLSDELSDGPVAEWMAADGLSPDVLAKRLLRSEHL